MGDAEVLKERVRRAYRARAAGDVDGTLAAFTDDATLLVNAAGVGAAAMDHRQSGQAALRAAVQNFVANFRFEDFEEIAFVVEGDHGACHWRANVVCIPTGRSAVLDAVDMITFRDGKIADLLQNTDTATLKSLIFD